jgi:transposase
MLCPVGFQKTLVCDTQKGKSEVLDITTVKGKIKEIREDFGVTETIFVGDRGMISTENFDSFDLKLSRNISRDNKSTILGAGLHLDSHRVSSSPNAQNISCCDFVIVEHA